MKIRDVKNVSNRIFAKSGVEADYTVERKYHYPSEITSLIERTKNQFALLQVCEENRPEAIYCGGQAFELTKAFFIYSEDNHAPWCFIKNCVESRLLNDGSTVYLFQIGSIP